MNHIKYLRIMREMTQFDVECETGIDQSIISKYERGECMPTTQNLIILAEFFQTSLDYLIGRTEEQSPYPSTPKKTV